MNLPKFNVAVMILFALSLPHVSNAAQLTLQWDGPSDGITTGYILYYGTASESYSQQVDVGSATLHTLNGLLDGTTYYFAVQAYDATGATSNHSVEIFEAIAPYVPPVVTTLALTANVASPQVLGTTVSWQATATGGVTPYQFQWAFVGGDQNTVSPWTTAATSSWNPSKAGSYQASVAVRSSGNSSAVGEMVQSVPFTIMAPVVTVALQSSVVSPQMVGTTIGWSASASGSAVGYQYSWWLFDGSVWKQKVNWTTSSTWSWIPPVASTRYIVAVWVRKAGSTGGAEAKVSVPFTIK